MLSLLLAYIFLFSWFTIVGFSINKLLFSSKLPLFDSFILAVSIVSLLALGLSLYTPLNVNVSVFVIFSTSLVSGFFSFKELKHEIGIKLSSIKKTDITFIVLAYFLIAWYSVSPPFFIDNDTYYLPTIKWMREYGAVPGLANIHFRFSLFSSWHALESIVQGVFSYTNTFPLNGFLLFAFWTHAIVNRAKNSTYRYFLALSPLFLLFTGMSAPDLPVFLISTYLLYQFTQQELNLNFAVAVSSCLVLIKPFLFLLPIFFLVQLIIDFKQYKKLSMAITVVAAFFALAVLLNKNYILTGYLFSPTVLDIATPDWAIPKDVLKTFNEIAVNELFGTVAYADRFSIHALTSLLVNGNSENILFTVLIVISIVFPVVIIKSYKKTKITQVYVFCCVMAVTLYGLWPAPRFLISFIALLLGFLMRELAIHSKAFNRLFGILIVTVSIIPIVLLANGIRLSNNPLMQSEETDSYFPKLLKREKNTLHNYQYEEVTIGNFTFYQTSEDNSFWLSHGNAPLPSASRREINYYQNYLGYIPQMRGDSLSDGFYSKKIFEE